MNFIRNLFSGKESKPPSSSTKIPPGEDQIITGTQASSVVNKLILQARKEKWSPTYSIKLFCTNCDAPVTLKKNSATEFVFVSAKGSFMPGGLEESIACSKCEGTTFRVSVQPKTLEAKLKEALLELTPMDQDPYVGFREDITGNFIHDRKLREVSGFDQLWLRILPVVDPEDQINTKFTFDMLNGRYLDRTIPGLLLYNYQFQKTIIILKDQTGKIWYSIEP